MKSKKNTADKILKTALTLFAKNGYERTTVDEIAAKTKISKGLVYFYFSSKETILITLINSAFDEEEPDFKEASPIEVIESFIMGCKTALSHSLKWKLIMSLLFQTNNKGNVKKLLQEKYTQYHQFLTLQFQELNYNEPEKEASLLLAIVDGCMLHAAFAKDPKDMEALLDHTFYKYKNTYNEDSH